MRKKAVFCFIDDADFELDNFRANSAPFWPGVEFVYGKSFEEAREALGERMPLAFLLDIYGAAPKSKVSPEVDFQNVCTLAESAEVPQPSWDELVWDLNPDDQEDVNTFLRRVHERVAGGERVFTQVACKLGQSRAYGLFNLSQVRVHYPWAAALGYSRKALYADAAAMTLAGADGCLQKPQGSDAAAIAQATLRETPVMAGVVVRAVNRRIGRRAGAVALDISRTGGSPEFLEQIEEALAHVGPVGLKPPTRGRYETAEALMKALKTLPAGAKEKQTVEALARWLGRPR